MKNGPSNLTRRQREIFAFLRDHAEALNHPPTLDELCGMLGLTSRGSLHKQIQALIDAGLVEPMHKQQRGVRLTQRAIENESTLPLLGYIAAGRPIEAIKTPETIEVPAFLRGDQSCYVLQVKGDSMIEDGILDGDWVVIEQRESANNGEIVVALIDNEEATLKRIEQHPRRVILHPANAGMEPVSYRPDQVQIQGVLIGQMRRYG